MHQDQNVEGGSFHRLLGILFLLALLVRALFVLHHANMGWQLRFDPSYYLTLAEGIRQGAYSMFHPLNIPDTTRMPGYPSIIYLLGGKVWLVLVVQVIVSALKVPLVFLLSRTIGMSVRFALLAALFMVLEPIDVVLAGSVLTETFFTTLFLCGMILLLRSMTWPTVIGAALVFAAAAWVRPNALVIGLFAGILHYTLLRKGMAAPLVFASLLILGTLPWMLRNQQATGRFILSDSGPVAAAYFHLPEVLAHAEPERAPTYRRELDQRARAIDWTDRDGVITFYSDLRSDVRSTFRDHPFTWLRIQLRKTTMTFVAPGRGHLQQFFPGSPLIRMLLGLLSMAITCLLIAGLLSMLWNWSHAPKGLVVIVVVGAAILFSSGISSVDARFKNPAMPLLLVATVWAIAQLQQRLSAGQARAL